MLWPTTGWAMTREAVGCRHEDHMAHTLARVLLMVFAECTTGNTHQTVSAATADRPSSNGSIVPASEFSWNKSQSATVTLRIICTIYRFAGPDSPDAPSPQPQEIERSPRDASCVQRPDAFRLATTFPIQPNCRELEHCW